MTESRTGDSAAAASRGGVVDRGSREGGRVVAARQVGGGEGWQHQDGGREDCGGWSGV